MQEKLSIVEGLKKTIGDLAELKMDKDNKLNQIENAVKSGNYFVHTVMSQSHKSIKVCADFVDQLVDNLDKARQERHLIILE